MSALDAAVESYEKALVDDGDGVDPGRIGGARGDILAAVGRRLRESVVGTEVVDALRRAIAAVAAARGVLSPQEVAFEEGAFDAILTVVRTDSVATLSEQVRAITRNAHLVRILRALRELGELSNQRLAAASRLSGGDLPATDSEQQMTSRRVAELRRHDLVFTMIAGRERLVRLTAAGEDLLDHVDRGHVPESDPGPEIAEIPEVRLRPMLRDVSDAPRVAFPADDRSRFYLYVGGLYVADQLLARPRWSPSERVLANLLWQHPLSDWPYAADIDVYLRVVTRWTDNDTTARDLMNVLFKHQRDEARDTLAIELEELGRRVNGPLTLLWAPAALNAAAWSRWNDLDLHTPLLRTMEARLAPIEGVPLALQLRAFARVLQGDLPAAEAMWQRMRTEVPRGAGVLGEAIRRANTQLVGAALVNPSILRVDTEAGRAVLAAAREAHAPFDTERPRVREKAWLEAFLAWLERDADRVEAAFARAPHLPAACTELVSAARGSMNTVEFERPAFESAVAFYRENASWLLDLSEGRVGHGAGALAGDALRRARNVADGAGHIAAAHCRERKTAA